jgi:hypothetical protein
LPHIYAQIFMSFPFDLVANGSMCAGRMVDIEAYIHMHSDS